MKKLLSITTALCAVACGFTGLYSGAASAENETLDYYPERFTETAVFGDLKDYAVNGEKYAFLDGNDVFEYAASSLTKLDTDDKTVSSVRYNGEALVYKSGENYYNAAGESVNYTDTVEDNNFIANGWTYGFNNDGVLVAMNFDEDKKTYPESYKLLRKYGGKAYAVSENKLYELNGGSGTELEFEYLDFKAVENINAADAAAAIAQLNSQAPQFVTVTSGAFMTEIDLDASNETFSAKQTVTATAGTAAMLLGKVGAEDGVAIIMVSGETDGKCYILRSQNTASVQRDAVEEKSLGATVTVAEGFVYSAPFVCAKTQVHAIKSGDKLNVAGELKKETNPELARDFYKVSWTDENEETQTGYVPLGYVSLFTISEEPPVVTPDPDYTQENSIRPVILVLLVIVLVLAAVGYLIFVSTSNKPKKQKPAKSDDFEQNPKN